MIDGELFSLTCMMTMSCRASAGGIRGFRFQGRWMGWASSESGGFGCCSVGRFSFIVFGVCEVCWYYSILLFMCIV